MMDFPDLFSGDMWQTGSHFLDYVQFLLLRVTHSLIYMCSVGQYFSHVIMRKTVLKQVFNLFIPSSRRE